MEDEKFQNRSQNTKDYEKNIPFCHYPFYVSLNQFSWINIKFAALLELQEDYWRQNNLKWWKWEENVKHVVKENIPLTFLVNFSLHLDQSQIRKI